MAEQSTYLNAEGNLRVKISHPEIAFAIGRAIGCVFDHTHPVLLGKNTAYTNYMIEFMLAAGVMSAGMRVTLTGPLPPSGVGLLTQSMRAGIGVFISGLSNTDEDTVITIVDAKGIPLGADDLLKITNWLAEYEPGKGAYTQRPASAKRVDDVGARYIEKAKGRVPELTLTGIRIVVDCAHGTLYNTAPMTLEELGAEVITIGVSPDGHNLNRESGICHPEVARTKVKELRADFGLVFNGDGTKVALIVGWPGSGSEISDYDARTIPHDHLSACVRGASKIYPRYSFEAGSDDALILGLQVLAISQEIGKKISDLFPV